ncbi:MAG: hypothetical protein WCP19_05960, partial [Chloroflexota bacterium]
MNYPDMLNKKLLIRYITREIFGLAGMGTALFWSAGSLTWLPAWGEVLVNAAWLTGMFFIMLRKHPALLAYRLGPKKGGAGWDTLIVSLMGLAQLARCIIAGLDFRYSWTGRIQPVFQVFGWIIGAGGYLLLLNAVYANPFFSQVYRVQKEREHRVIDS